MSQDFKTPITLNFQTSNILTAILLISHIGAVCCLLIISVSAVIKMLLIIAILFSAVYNIFHYALLQSKNSVIGVVLYEHDCTLSIRGGSSHLAELDLTECVNTDSIIVLKINYDNKHCRVPVVRDMLESDTYRQLRVYLKLKPA